mmetsp:Transcript_27073/g.39240  ORF Transcript_27073/g.39240 Transcript_27073/m.39240 type:complete len:87 (+) Transcript_27073:412-672(+)
MHCTDFSVMTSESWKECGIFYNYFLFSWKQKTLYTGMPENQKATFLKRFTHKFKKRSKRNTNSNHARATSIPNASQPTKYISIITE